MSLEDLLAAIGQGAPSGLVRRAWICAECRRQCPEGARLCEVCAERERTERQRAHLADAWESVPERFRDAWRWDWDDKRGATIALMLSQGGSFLLRGKPGMGKTALACAVLGRHLTRATAPLATWPDVEDAASMRYVTDADLNRAVSAHPLGQGDAPLYREAVRAKLLVLDELGVDLASPRRVGRDVLFARYDANRPTIVTTGHERAQVEAHWGGGAGRRIWTQSLDVNMDAFPAMAVVR
ncbi:hypothetical protein K0U83_17470 [bacterium]|nr:hypothetical protein [bacterium]